MSSSAWVLGAEPVRTFVLVDAGKVVDAIDESAVDFCAPYGFLAVPEHPRRLFRRIKDVRASLDRTA